MLKSNINTTLKVDQETLKELQYIRVHPRQSYDEIIRNILMFYRANGGFEELLMEQLKRNPDMKDKLVSLGELSRLTDEEKELRKRVIDVVIKMYEELQQKHRDMDLYIKKSDEEKRKSGMVFVGKKGNGYWTSKPKGEKK